MKQCPRCGAPIDPLWKSCTLCFYKLEQDESSPSSSEANTAVEANETLSKESYSRMPQGTYGYEQERSPHERKGPSPLLYIGLFVVLIGIVAGIAFATNHGSGRTASSTPADPSQISQQAGVPGPAVASAPEGNSGALPQYVRQYTNEQPPCLRQSGEQVHLVNNPKAKDVSFAELKSFISQDDTDAEEYLEGVRICGDFAEMLHNNAESKGIKTAWVAIDFEDSTIGHALNAFQTTDRGMVYVDCTGSRQESVLTYREQLSAGTSFCNRDMIAYVEKGQKYGLIGIDRAESLSYSFYVEYAWNWQKFDAMIDDFNDDVYDFNRTYASKTSLPEAEYREYEAWKAELKGKERLLNGMENKLGNCFAEPLGIVKTVDIYW